MKALKQLNHKKMWIKSCIFNMLPRTFSYLTEMFCLSLWCVNWWHLMVETPSMLLLLV